MGKTLDQRGSPYVAALQLTQKRGHALPPPCGLMICFFQKEAYTRRASFTAFDKGLQPIGVFL